MARQRVQVAPLEAPTTVRPVASPVDTYIRPAEEPKAKSGLSEFISAITPALKAEAQQEIDARQKQNEKIEAGIASREAFQSKLARAELISEATNGFENNKEYYLEAGRDKLAADRKKYITDYVTDLEAAGTHPNIIAEIKNDFELATAKFFLDPKDGYNVQKADYDLNKRDEQVFQQVFKIDDDPNIDRETKTAEIADIMESYIKLRGNTKEFFDKFIPLEVTRSKSRGQTSIYDYLNSDLSKNRLKVSDYIEAAESIKGNQASLNKAQKTANKPLIKKAAADKAVADAVSTNNPSLAKVGEKVTLPDGTGGSFETTMTKEMVATAADKQFFLADEALRNEVEALSIAKSQGRSDPATFDTVMETLKQQRVDLEARFFNSLYNPHEIVPDRYKMPITAGLPFLQGGDVSEGSQGLDALGRGLKAIRDFKSMGGSMSTLKLSKQQQLKVDALNALLESGRELRDIAPFAAKDVPSDFGEIESLVTEELVKDKIDTGAIDITNIDEAQIGYPSLLMDVQEQAKAIMFMSEVPISAEEAVALAIPQVRDNYLTLRTSQWDAFALGDPRHFSVVKKLGGQINSEANEKTLNDILTRTFENERIKEIMAPRLAAIGSSTTGVFDPDMAFAWQQDSRNANMLNLMAYAEGDYSRMVRVGTVNLQTLTKTSSVVFANELAAELNKTVEQADTTELMANEAQRLAAESGIAIATQDMSGGTSDIMDRINQAQAFAASQSVSPTQVVEPEETESIFSSIVDSVSSLFTGDEAQAATLPSETTPSETTRTIFTDQTGKVADMTGNTVAEKAGNLIKTQEGFKPNPYKDGKDRSVGYGFYLPALEPDELALIKDVENITQEEADAVMELKTRKISTFLADEITNFEALPEETQLGVISMAYQLGAPNLPSSWPSFMKAIKEAASAPEGSAEQTAALEEAAFNMLYNRKADGSTTKTKWYQQTPNRAEEMAAAVKG